MWVAAGSLQLTRRPLVSTVAPLTSWPASHADCGAAPWSGEGAGGNSSRVSSPGPVPIPAPRARAPPHRRRDLTRHPSADPAGLQPRGRAPHRPQPGRARGRRGGQEAGRPRGQDHRCAARGPSARTGCRLRGRGRDGSETGARPTRETRPHPQAPREQAVGGVPAVRVFTCLH